MQGLLTAYISVKSNTRESATRREQLQCLS